VESGSTSEEHHLDNDQAESLRRSQQSLKKYPQATQYEMELTRLEVARALAGNTRAMLQVGNADDISRAFIMRDILRDVPAVVGDEASPEKGLDKAEEK
jgi:hypothetical protein